MKLRTAKIMFVWLTVALGCADDEDPTEGFDAGSDDGGMESDAAEDAGPDVGPPLDVGPRDVEPEDLGPDRALNAPRLTPCPSGWSEVDDPDGLTICEPWPDSSPIEWECPDGWTRTIEDGVSACEPLAGAAACSADAAWFPGGAECTRIGTACPYEGDDFASDLPTDRPIVFVSDGAVGGDGSRGAPLGSLREVELDRLADGAVVALSPGTYSGLLAWDGDIALWGACVSGTILTSTSAGTASDGLITVRDRNGAPGRAEIRNLTIADSPGMGISGIGGSDVDLRDVIIERTSSFGVFVTDGELIAERVIVRDIRSSPSGFTGLGIVVSGADGRALLNQVRVERTRRSGLQFQLGATVTMNDSVISNIDSTVSDGTSGWGLTLFRGAVAEVNQTLIERARGSSIAVLGSELRAQDLVINDSRGTEAGGFAGVGLSFSDTSTGSIKRALIRRSRTYGILANSGTNLTIDNVIVRDTLGSDFDGSLGQGIALFQSRFEGHGITLERNRSASVFMSATTATITQAQIRDTFREDGPDPTAGFGLLAQEGSRLYARDVAIDRTDGIGLFLGTSNLGGTEGAVADIENIVIRDTESFRSGRGGRGVLLASDVSARVAKFRLDRNRELGIGVFGTRAPTMAQLANGLVRDTESTALDGELGAGIRVTDADVEASRVWSIGNRHFGILVTSTVASSHVELDEVASTNTRLPDCALDDACEVDPEATGIAALGDVTVRISRSEIGGLPTDCGLFLADGANIEVTDSLVFDNDIGACIQVEGFDTTRVRGPTNRYIGNRIPSTFTSIELPRIDD